MGVLGEMEFLTFHPLLKKFPNRGNFERFLSPGFSHLVKNLTVPMICSCLFGGIRPGNAHFPSLRLCLHLCATKLAFSVGKRIGAVEIWRPIFGVFMKRRHRKNLGRRGWGAGSICASNHSLKQQKSHNKVITTSINITALEPLSYSVTSALRSTG